MNRFWRNTKTEKHRPDDPLDTTPPGTPPAPSGKKFQCVFCDCVMTGDGLSIWSMGSRAKDYADGAVRHGKALEKKDEEITALRAEIAAMKAELDALKGSNRPANTGHRLGSKIA